MTLQTACTGKTTTEETTPEKANTLASATEIINSRCPEMVDQESRLDSVLLSDEGHLAYYYTLLERDSSFTMVINYRDRQGEFITEFLVGPGRYR